MSKSLTPPPPTDRSQQWCFHGNIPRSLCLEGAVGTRWRLDLLKQTTQFSRLISLLASLLSRPRGPSDLGSKTNSVHPCMLESLWLIYIVTSIYSGLLIKDVAARLCYACDFTDSVGSHLRPLTSSTPLANISLTVARVNTIFVQLAVQNFGVFLPDLETSSFLSRMACLDPNEPNDPFEPPRTPRMVLKDAESEELSPDTEQNVAEQTDGIFRNFVYHMYNIDRDLQDADDTPNLPELTAFSDQPLAPTAQIGRQLAIIGDDINDRYAPHFNQMIQTLNITPDTAYEAFAGVARKLFRDGNINWGRVITLLCFGYRMAVTVIQRGIRGFFSNIVGFVVKFIITEKIAQWIAEQGGWRAALRYVPETLGWPVIGAILSFAAISVLTAMFLSRK